jgi:hypothetical protein
VPRHSRLRATCVPSPAVARYGFDERPPFFYLTESNSTSNVSVARGGTFVPSPRPP